MPVHAHPSAPSRTQVQVWVVNFVSKKEAPLQGYAAPIAHAAAAVVRGQMPKALEAMAAPQAAEKPVKAVAEPVVPVRQVAGAV